MSKAKSSLKSIATDIIYRPSEFNMDVKPDTVSVILSKTYSSSGYSFLFDKKLATKVIKDIASEYTISDHGSILNPDAVDVEIKTKPGFMDSHPEVSVEIKYTRLSKPMHHDFGGFFDGFM